MGNWSTGSVKLNPIEFDGDTVIFHAKRLLMEDMLTLAKHFDAAAGVMRFADPAAVCKIAADILPKYMTDIEGMVDKDGMPVPLETLLAAAGEFYFAPLLGRIFVELVTISMVGSQLKNSDPPSPASSEA